MSPSFDLWSLPWHTLQRALANGAVAADRPAVSPRRALFPAETQSWLARARILQQTGSFGQALGERRAWQAAGA